MARQKKRTAKTAPTSRLLQEWGAHYDEILPEGYKMSAVFLEFMEPYVTDDMEPEEQHLRFRFSQIAWNASFLPMQKWLQEFISVLKPFPPADQIILKDMFASMVERKRQNFAEYRRFITDFEILDQGDDYRLLVLSVPIEDEKKNIIDEYRGDDR